MPLDTSTYALSLLRLDGRRWNELRRIHAQISTQAAADGSSYLEMGNTKVLCTVSGPSEGRRAVGAGSAGNSVDADIRVDITVAAFSGVDRKGRQRGDKRASEIQTTIANAFGSTVFTNLYPHSTISIALSVLSQDGSLLAACLNACTLALVDAGIPMRDYITACTAGSTGYETGGEGGDPLLDMNGLEEQELPFLTVGTLGAGGTEGGRSHGEEEGDGEGGGEKVVVLVMDTKVRTERLEGMLAVGVDGCRQVREVLDRVVRREGRRKIEGRIS